jgi:cobalt-zinc-cadmium efflux system outer membrane protein
MVRTACLLAAVALPPGTAAAGAQASPPGRPAPADTLVLTLADARRLALRQNPELLAGRQETEAARGRLRQARLPLFNPQAEVVVLPGAPGGVGFEATLSQEAEWAGQRGLRSRAAGFGLARAEALARDAARLAAEEASTSFYTAFAARERLRLAEDALSLAGRLADAVRTQAREGEISTLEADLAEIESGRARARVLAARRDLAAAELELRRATGLPAERPLRLADDLPPAPDPAGLSADSLAATALARRPDLRARAAEADEARTQARLAGREAVPNLRLGLRAERGEDGSGTRLGVVADLPLPLLNRNQGRVQEEQARAGQAEMWERATGERIRAQAVAAAEVYAAAADEVRVYESSVLQPARRSRARLDTAYRAGKIGLPTLLLVRNQILEAETGYWDAWLAHRRALAALESAIAAGDGETGGALLPGGGR